MSKTAPCADLGIELPIFNAGMGGGIAGTVYKNEDLGLEVDAGG